jgi:hypothetical protein
MDDDVKARFEDFDKRIAGSDKRFDDLKWYFGGVTTLFTVGFSVLTILLSWNYKSERDNLRDDVRQMKEDLGRLEVPAYLELRTPTGEDAQGHEITARFERDNTSSKFWLGINLAVRNTGDSSTGALYFKLYTNDDELHLNHPSSDESNYKYEDVVDPTNFGNLSNPGKLSREVIFSMALWNGRLPKPGSYKALMKMYYGKGQVATASVTFLVSDNPMVTIHQ